MALPPGLAGRLRLPLVVAPMFLVSGPELVLAACRAGAVGAFPTANCRTPTELDDWLGRISGGLGAGAAPPAANLIVHRTNRRLADDLALVVKHRVPLVIASVGSPAPAIAAVHGYGGLLLADVASMRHAEKALAAGADGLVLLSAGAGGQTGWANPFAFVRAARRLFDGPLLLAGGVADGQGLRAAEVLGADLAYMGTRFIATAESLAADRYKAMLVASGLDDVLLTRAFTGLPTNMLRPSIVAAGLDPEALPERGALDVGRDIQAGAPRRWRDVWSAGHGVALVDDCPSTAMLVERLGREYEEAKLR